MIFTLDAGNTHIKIGAWDDDKLAFVSRLQTNVQKTRDEYAISLMDLLQLNGYNNAQFDGAILSCVVPPLALPLRSAIKSVIHSQRIYQVGPGLKTGLNIKIDNPASLGADMVAAAVAALHKYPMPCIIISLGTATAIFVMDAEGSFLGGSVSAGVSISLEALAMRTAMLPHISLDEPGNIIGTNTIDSIKAGAIYGTADLLDGMIARIKEVIGSECTVVATGGHARSIAAHCKTNMVLDSHIVLEGLRLLYHKNNK